MPTSIQRKARQLENGNAISGCAALVLGDAGRMKIEGLRSGLDTVGGLVYFGRMIDKIRLHQAGKLPEDYQPNLGKGFDLSCCEFLRVSYPALVERVKTGGSDEEILEWVKAQSEPRTEEETKWWTNHMRKWGWRDVVSERLKQRIAEAGIVDDGTVQTFLEFIDADEDRLPVNRIAK
jgi:gluconokinase